ncbi:MAG: hypothetical protein CM1200mP21_04450 [Candidatus Poseidoniales archaeon]|nr:MAG: hypothetical protein CM1200mP21_04450 [Candidatus Poseidoniales archaeon]
MAAFFGLVTLYHTFPWTPSEVAMPLIFLGASALLMRYYRGMSPPPEQPFTMI